MQEQEVLYLSKTERNSKYNAYWIEESYPDRCTLSAEPSISSIKEIAIGYLFAEAIGKKITSASFEFGTTEFSEYGVNAEIYLKLYSGNSEQLTFNKLKNNCTELKWNNADKIQLQVKNYDDYVIDLSEYIDVFSEIINSGNEIIIVIGLESGGPEWITFDLHEGGKRDATLAIKYRYPPKVPVKFPDDASIAEHLDWLFTWEYDGADSYQVSYEIGWCEAGSITWNDIIVDSQEQEHIFVAGSFPLGKINWRVRATNNDGDTGEYSYGTFTYYKEIPKVQIEFPNGLNIPNSTEQFFTWIYDGNGLEQQSYEIGWSTDEGNTWTTVIGENANTYHMFEANTFSVGPIKWRIKVTNSIGNSCEYVYGNFGSVGRGNAPVIESITQNAIPLIIWSAEYQIAYELQISDGSQIIFSTGMIGGENKEYRPNIMLNNGNYIVQLRIMNIYGFISEWVSAALILVAEEPTSYASFDLTENAAYGAVFDYRNIVGNGYIVRVEDGQETIVGKCSGEEICDYYTKSEKTYTYILREHVEGYLNVKEVTFKANFIGVLLHDALNYENFVNIKWNESDYVEVNDTLTKNTVYHNCIGRIYPIKESNEQKTEIVTVTGFLDHDACDKLRYFYESDKIVLLRSNSCCFTADISAYKENRYFDKGYLVQVSLTRIEDNSEVNLL